MTLVMQDTAQNDQFAPGADAYAGYVDGGVGDQPNAAWVAQAFPHVHHLSIALFAGNDADCLDVEPGAASVPDVAEWVIRQKSRGIARPVVYASVSTMNAEIVPIIETLPGARAQVRIWTAHYGLGEHICGPSSCGQLSIEADGTQWTSNAMGRNLDQSLLLPDFFGTVKPPAHPSWMEKIMKALPVLRQGSADHAAVRRVQALVNAGREDRGLAPIAEDGVFGPVTATAVEQAQAQAKIARDEIVGPATWAVLLGVA